VTNALPKFEVLPDKWEPGKIKVVHNIDERQSTSSAYTPAELAELNNVITEYLSLIPPGQPIGENKE